MLRTQHEHEALATAARRNVARVAHLKRRYGAKSLRVAREKTRLSAAAALAARQGPDAQALAPVVTFKSTLSQLVPVVLDLKRVGDATRDLLAGLPPLKSRTLATNIDTLLAQASRVDACLETLSAEVEHVARRADALERVVLDYTHRLSLANNPLLAEPLLVYAQCDADTLPPFAAPPPVSSEPEATKPK